MGDSQSVGGETIGGGGNFGVGGGSTGGGGGGGAASGACSVSVVAARDVATNVSASVRFDDTVSVNFIDGVTSTTVAPQPQPNPVSTTSIIHTTGVSNNSYLLTTS